MKYTVILTQGGTFEVEATSIEVHNGHSYYFTGNEGQMLGILPMDKVSAIVETSAIQQAPNDDVQAFL